MLPQTQSFPSAKSFPWKTLLLPKRSSLDAEQWVIGLALEVTIEKRQTLQRHGVKTVAVFSDSQAAI